jgi:very-short-patch-repair endonuclease
VDIVLSTGWAPLGWRRGGGLSNLVGVADLSDVCRRQQGIVTRRQCLAGGMAAGRIRTRLRSGRWQRLHAGVYATFTGVVPRDARLWAAVLAAGPGAALSHQTAAALAGLCDHGTIHVTVPHQRRVSLAGVTVHISARVDAARHPTRTPPQTRVEETVIDLAQAAPDLATALGWVTKACAARLTTAGRLRTALTQRKKARWRAELSATLDDVRLGAHSMLELRYLHRVERRHALPEGVRQRPRPRPGGRWYDDVSYPQYATVVELDGRVAHPEHARGRDRKRDNAFVVAGGDVLRYDLADVVDAPCVVAADVAAVLRRNGWPGTPEPCGPRCAIRDREG